MAIAFIPARGGSKGIPRKNLVEVAGKPLVQWSVEHAMDAQRIRRVIVSTDDPEIGEVANSLGAEIHWRSKHASGDRATTESAIDEWQQTCELSNARICLLQPTSPIRSEGIIDRALERLDHCDSVFSGRIVEGYMWTRDNGGLRPVNPSAYRFRRQDDPQQRIEENGSLYCFWLRQFRRCKNRLYGRIQVIVQDAFESFQIDTRADIQRMEQLFALRDNANIR